MSSPVVKPAAPRKGSFWHSVKTIGWAFLGIRKKSGYQEDLARANPFHIVAVAIGAVAIFVIVLISIIKWVVLK
ncbi:DUF2970 domain-containing protein [Rhodoferax sediminis]|uniref:DUF2970 domain-containing protein n=1 Tax=Rhodoferax sediminis TaxID=2509614 RepID=A0A515DEU9_9BURK|nr:DUF2970 domain-containing protein [Rhodoferax sediminis]QDL38941.1 DUF2970 domain-containing protein [Rhodoferax sediminis]